MVTSKKVQNNEAAMADGAVKVNENTSTFQRFFNFFFFTDLVFVGISPWSVHGCPDVHWRFGVLWRGAWHQTNLQAWPHAETEDSLGRTWHRKKVLRWAQKSLKTKENSFGWFLRTVIRFRKRISAINFFGSTNHGTQEFRRHLSRCGMQWNVLPS